MIVLSLNDEVRGAHVIKPNANISTILFNTTNAIRYESFEQVLEVFGSTWFWDSFWLFFTTPISIFGFLTNLLSLYVFLQSEFQKLTVYNYLRVIVTNSAILCFFTIFDFVFYSRRYFTFVNTYWANAYNCFIHEPITNTAYFFGSVLDIIIMLDRLSTFSRKYRVIPEAIEWWKVTIGTLMICIVINGPYYFVNLPTEFSFQIATSNQAYIVYAVDQSDFSTTVVGRVLTFGIYFIRDFLTMVISIVLNILSVVCLKQYLKNHAKITRRRVLKLDEVREKSNLFVLFRCSNHDLLTCFFLEY